MNSISETLLETDQESRLFFVLSGEHTTLPAAEVQAILESSGIESGRASRSYRLLALNAPVRALKAVSERSLMYDSSGVLLGECEADPNEIQKLVKNQPIDRIARNARTFAVRSVRLGGASKSVQRTNLDRNLGAVVKGLVPRLTVQLRDPELTFLCVISEEKCLFGVSVFQKPSGLVAPRLPRRRPVFHPATMPPKLARCMVNLARSFAGAVFADPFSGVGGISLEAAVIGCRVLSLDANLRMLRGARRNLKHFMLPTEGFLKADAKHLPVRELDAIATDPPYGRDSSTMGTKVTTLFAEFLQDAKHCLKDAAHMCISAPVEVDIEGFANQAGFKMKERHLSRVHRSLTRQFVVLQNL